MIELISNITHIFLQCQVEFKQLSKLYNLIFEVHICDNYEGCPTYYYFTILTTDIEKYACGNNVLLTDGCG